MTQEERIKRINELYHLSKERALTEEEKKEQGLLRAEYLSEIRSSVKDRLKQIRIVEKDGSEHPVLSVREKKKLFREKCLEIRKELSPERLLDAGEFLTGEVLKIVKILKVNKVLLYASKDMEVPTDLLFKELKSHGVKCYYPKTAGDEIRFFSVDDLDELKTGSFNVREPEENDEKKFDFSNDKDSVLILVPGLSFDDGGNRIGYGKGYYDRFLSGFESESWIKSAGVCFAECKALKVISSMDDRTVLLVGKGIPADKNDIRTDFVITV